MAMAMAMAGMADMADMAGMATIILNQEQRLLVPLTMLKSVSAALAALPALVPAPSHLQNLMRTLS